MSDNIVLKMTDIHVSYGTVKALNGVNFDLYDGEIHALVGEHRAGKSSLVKLLSGAVQKKSGTIAFRGNKIEHFSPRISADNGIGMVYQNTTVIETLNSVENIFTGQCILNKAGFLSSRRMVAETRRLFDGMGLDFDCLTPLYNLAVGQQHMVEIAKAIMMKPEIIILDEVSAKLTPEEMKTVYRIIQEYRGRGKSIIYISHDMDEILRLADRVTILKNGYSRGTEHVSDLDKYRLFQLTYSFVLDKEEIERENTRFHLMRSYIENLLHHLPIGAVLLDDTGAFQIINSAAKSILAMDEKTEVDNLDAILSMLPEETAEQLKMKVRKHEEHVWEEVQIGNQSLVNLEAFPFKDESFGFTGTIILIQDTSLNQYLSDYIIKSEKMASVAEVAVGVAHEINNPLFIIQNYVELLKSDSSNSSDDLVKIEKELARIVEIVGSLLSFSQSQDITRETVQLPVLLDEILLLLNHNLSEKRIKLQSSLSNISVEVAGEENRLKQLFMNLILNSIDAVLSGGKIELSVSASTDHAEVLIKDNGYGIPDDIREKIFDPFFSTKINKKNTGLGLSICMQIVKEHNGYISFESIPGKQTTFAVSLPLVADSGP
jgi:two-component system, NtrC family, sensor histidine kinase AtoS